MKMTFHRVDLPLAREFTIARGSISVQPSLLVELEHDGVCGLGEVPANRYYGHTLDSIADALDDARPLLDGCTERDSEELWQSLKLAVHDNLFALSAIDMAIHDLRCKQRGVPLWHDWGLTWQDPVHSSYTIGIDPIETMIEKLQETAGWSAYKIKLGTDHDVEIVRQLREHTDASLRVDANCGWSAEETIKNSHAFAELGVEFIEQPLPVDAPDQDKRRVREHSVLPVVADEDCQQRADVSRCQAFFHGVNVKVCKCGGLTPALAMLREARQLGMKVMIGCMVESSIAISATAQLLPLLDYADLDGAILLRDEPAHGMVIEKGEVQRLDAAGCGAGLDYERLASFASQSQHPGLA